MTRCILITGATGKIGRVLTQHFLCAGETVVAAGRSAEALFQLTEDMARNCGALYTLHADLMEPNAAASVLEGLAEINCMPDCLINNARNVSFLKIGEDGLISRQDFLNEFALDVITPYELVMALANVDGSRLRAVVNIGSQYGTVAPNLRLYNDPAHQSPLQYGVCKAALAHLTKELAVRLANRDIRINCVAFGGVEGRVDDEFMQRYSALSPIGRMLGEHELAGPVDLLLSDNSSAITGHIMLADGGWSIW